MDDKVIVTNLSALKTKYGTAGLGKILSAVQGLIAADKKRGITTRLVGLDHAPTMKKLNAPVVSNAADPKQNKQAIDGVFKQLLPDYLMILGAVDVVPHQDIKNTMPSDGDPIAWGDIPYACEAGYSQQPQNFTGPTRVVGRLPDLTGGGDPSYLVGLLDTAAEYKSLKPSDYQSYLGISALVWRKSTEMSLTNLFGSGADLQLSPDQGPKWGSPLISRRVHFINCHGADGDFHFYGQRGQNYPQAHDASFFAGKIKEGTVVAAECCYGGQLYNPNLTGNQAGIGNTYLANKAYGFLGSTTIAYGPAEGNGSADLICQYFLRAVFKGASLGRAALEARQRFIESSPEMDPVDLKTLAQFNLLGDPSIIPVAVASATKATTKSRGKSAKAAATADAEAAATTRSDVRRQLMSKCIWLGKNHPVAVEITAKRGAKRGGPASKIATEMRRLAREANMTITDSKSFSIERAPEPPAMKRGAKAMRPASTAFHVIVGTPDGVSAAPTAPKTRGSKTRGSKTAPVAVEGPPPSARVKAVVAKEVDGKIVSVREVYGK